jgi:hypothetical protein
MNYLKKLVNKVVDTAIFGFVVSQVMVFFDVLVFIQV